MDLPLDLDDKTNGEKASQLIMCLGICSGGTLICMTISNLISSGIGKLASGIIADSSLFIRNNNRILLQQISFISIGVCTMFLTVSQLFQANVFEVRILFNFFCYQMNLHLDSHIDVLYLGLV